MWYKKKRFVAAIVTIILIGLGAASGINLTGFEESVTDAACQAVQCIE